MQGYSNHTHLKVLTMIILSSKFKLWGEQCQGAMQQISNVKIWKAILVPVCVQFKVELDINFMYYNTPYNL